MPKAIYHTFSVPWEVRDSVLVDSRYKKNLSHFPFDLVFSNANDQTALDDYVKGFVTMLYKPENQKLTVAYPTQESVRISVPGSRKSALVYLDESYDRNWKAYFNNRLQKVEPSGPNYMLVTLDNLDQSGDLILKHSWPTSFYVSIFLIILIPSEMALMTVIRWALARKHH